MKKSLSVGTKLSDKDISSPLLNKYNPCNGPFIQKAWSLSDSSFPTNQRPRLPLKSFNHISKEVINLEKSKNFYCDLLGFVVVPRPPFECDGYWLWGYQLSLHLVATRDKHKRKSVLKARYQHFTEALPRVDHFAFMTDDIAHVKEILDQANVFYTHEKPPGTGIEQLFFFDPDGNVIEVSTCNATIENGSWCHRDAETVCTDCETVHHVTSSMDLSNVEINLMCDGNDPVSEVRNVVEFEFADGTREQVVIGNINIGDKSIYAYDDSDFYSHRDSGSGSTTPSSSVRPSVENPSIDALSIRSEFSPTHNSDSDL